MNLIQDSPHVLLIQGLLVDRILGQVQAEVLGDIEDHTPSLAAPQDLPLNLSSSFSQLGVQSGDLVLQVVAPLDQLAQRASLLLDLGPQLDNQVGVLVRGEGIVVCSLPLAL